MSDKPLKIGADLGNGFFKAAQIVALPDVAPRINTATIPSVVGVGRADAGGLSLGSLANKKRTEHPDAVEWSGGSFLVGHNVALYAAPVQRMDSGRWGSSELQAIFYAGLHNLLGELDAGQQVAIMAGLPVDVFEDKENARRVLKTIRAWMVGEHSFTVSGHDVTLTVSRVEATAQPVGAYFNWGCDHRGKWARSKEDRERLVAIGDLGQGTVDSFAVQNGVIVPRYTAGAAVGLRRASERLIDVVRRCYAVELSVYEADALLRSEKPTVYAASKDGEVDLRHDRREALDYNASQVLEFFDGRAQWGRAAGFPIVFVGGGAEAHRDALLRQYPHAFIAQPAVEAVAIGLAKMAEAAF
jgi:hypothetical protein